MSSSGNLAQMFAQSMQQQQGSQELTHEPPSVSQAVYAEDDDHFENTTFQLKRTRSMGLLDEFIAPTKKLLEEQAQQKQLQAQQQDENRVESQSLKSRTSLDFDESANSGEFIENVDDVPAKEEHKNVNTAQSVITYDYDENELDHDSKPETHNDENTPVSPLLPDAEEFYQPHDDNDIVYEPSRHVDYLSHDWKEADISKSWRYIVLKRKDVANSARLENASWRTWAQAKYHLKTVSPESVNWLKDSDVTWLYGPIYKENGDEDTEKKYGSDGESSALNAIKREKKKKQQKQEKEQKLKQMQQKPRVLKPILKKRTVSEMLTQPSMIVLPPHHHHPQGRKSPINTDSHNPSPPLFEDDFDLISQRVNAQYNKQNKPQAMSVATAATGSGNGDGVTTQAQEQAQEQPVKRHIHFNDRVEQCRSINPPDPNDVVVNHEVDTDDYYDNYDDNDDDDGDDESDDSDDEGGFFLRVKSPSSAQLHGKEFLSMSVSEGNERLSNNSSSSLVGGPSPSRYQTIELLPSTTLNYGSDSESDEEKFVMSHRTNTGRGYNYMYDYNSVYQGNTDHLVHIGNTDYEVEDTPQHLEGVTMLDVPDCIKLGSNLAVDTPQPLNIEQRPEFQLPEVERTESNRSGFSLHSDSDSESESDNDRASQQRQTTSSPAGSVTGTSKNNNITKVSTSPSYASLSDVAAQGYIQSSIKDSLSSVFRKSQTDLNELQKDFSALSSGSEHESKQPALLGSWKKN